MNFTVNRPRIVSLSFLVPVALIFGSLCLYSVSVCAKEEIGKTSLVVTRSRKAYACPDERALVGKLRSLWLESSHHLPTETLLVDVRITQQDSEFIAEIHVGGKAHGVRMLSAEGPGCEQLTSALLASLSLILDNEIRKKKEQEKVPDKSDKARRKLLVRPPLQQPHVVSKWHGGLDLYAGPSSGFPHGISGVFGARWKMSRNRFSLALGGFWTPSREYSLPPGKVNLHLVGGDLKGCWQLFPEHFRWNVATCIQTIGAVMSGQAQGFDVNGEKSVPWISAGGGVEVQRWWSRRWQTSLGVGVQRLVHQQSFSIERLGTGYTPEFLSILVEGRVYFQFF
jgi:hypothetical protein